MALPTPTVLDPAAGYIPTGTTRYLIVDTIADVTAPSSAELTAGNDVTNLIGGVSGWSGTGATVDFPNAGSRWTSKVTGLISADDSSFTFNMDKSGSGDALALFNDGSDGTTATSTNVVICYEGITSGGRCRVFPVQVTSVQVSSDLAAPTTSQVNFAIVEPPSGFIAVPTA